MQANTSRDGVMEYRERSIRRDRSEATCEPGLMHAV